MYEALLATSSGRFILALVFDPRIIARMIDLLNRGLPTLGRFRAGCPSNCQIATSAWPGTWSSA